MPQGWPLQVVSRCTEHGSAWIIFLLRSSDYGNAIHHLFAKCLLRGTWQAPWGVWILVTASAISACTPIPWKLVAWASLPLHTGTICDSLGLTVSVVAGHCSACAKHKFEVRPADAPGRSFQLMTNGGWGTNTSTSWSLIQNNSECVPHNLLDVPRETEPIPAVYQCWLPDFSHSQFLYWGF